MCTVVLRHRPGHAWPLLWGANRDERLDRPWDPPGRWWPDRPGLIGGRDRMAGGTWMAVGDTGTVAAVLNRPGSLGPAAGMRSRGELPLLAAAAPSAEAAVERLIQLDVAAWRPFNLVVADRLGAVFVGSPGKGMMDVRRLPTGVTMVTAHDPNDPVSPRIARHLPRFVAAPSPDPGSGNWVGWATMLDDDSADTTSADALRVPPTAGFGTVCSTLLALGAAGERVWQFAHVRPGQPSRYAPVPF